MNDSTNSETETVYREEITVDNGCVGLMLKGIDYSSGDLGILGAHETGIGTVQPGDEFHIVGQKYNGDKIRFVINVADPEDETAREGADA